MAEEFRIFISWSKERSLEVAKNLKEFLLLMFDVAAPWVSDQDITPGSGWSEELAKQLNRASFGISVVTPENQHQPFLLFEAGSLTAQVGYRPGRVVPFLVGMSVADLDPPLGTLQCVEFEDDDHILKMLRGISNAISEAGLPAPRESSLVTSFKAHWPTFRGRITSVAEEGPAPTKRSDRDILEEILGTVRKLHRAQQRKKMREESLRQLRAIQKLQAMDDELARRKGGFQERSDDEDGGDDER